MNNLLFTALLIALLYYFFYYRPQPKKLIANPPVKHHQFTQTEEYQPEIKDNPDPAVIKNLTDEKQELLKDIQQKERTIIGLNNSYQKLETETKQEIDNLKKELSQKDQEIQELKSAEKTLDQMLKNIQDLNKELD